jgi:hypothetical protein
VTVGLASDATSRAPRQRTWSRRILTSGTRRLVRLESGKKEVENLGLQDRPDHIWIKPGNHEGAMYFWQSAVLPKSPGLRFVGREITDLLIRRSI